MHPVDESPPAVVVGIDGSEAAVGAALWGIDEAVARDVPLRLVYAIDPNEPIHKDATSFAHQLSIAETAVRSAFMAIEASEQPVKIEIEIVQEPPVDALIRASRSAVMMCLGATRHSCLKRVGSTALALSASAHCPVAVLRGCDSVVRGEGGWVGVDLDRTGPRRAVVKRAMDEARLRRAPLRLLTQQHTDRHETNDVAVDDGYDFRTVQVSGSIVDYLNDHTQSVKLFMVGPDDLGQLDDAGRSVLHDTGCPLLILRDADTERAGVLEDPGL